MLKAGRPPLAWPPWAQQVARLPDCPGNSEAAAGLHFAHVAALWPPNDFGLGASLSLYLMGCMMLHGYLW